MPTPEIEWRDITGMRHRLVHNYGAIRLEVIWEVVHNKLPGLIGTLRLLVPANDEPA